MSKKKGIVKCAKTSINANEWLLPLTDGTDQRAPHWRELDWTRAAADAIALQPFDELFGHLIASLELLRRLGSGSYGVAYSCRLPPVFGTAAPFVIKISKRLVELNLVLANMNTHRLLVRPLYTNEQRAAHAEAVTDFKQEFENYERIMDALPPHMQSGRLNIGLSQSEHAGALAREATMQQHPGHAHIHHIFHLDHQIPAILSERCDGTLDGLRAAASNLFEARFHDGRWHFSELWKQVTREMCDAVDYIRTRGLVHIDIKVNNVMYIATNRHQQHTTAYAFKLGDFGLLQDDAVTTTPFYTTEYFEPTDWSHALGTPSYAPMTLCCYTLAALLVCCLKLRDTDFPVAMDINTYDMYHNMDQEIQAFRANDSLGEEFFPPLGYIPLDYAQEMGDAWANINLILQHDYLHGRDVDLYRILQAIRASV